MIARQECGRLRQFIRSKMGGLRIVGRPFACSHFRYFWYHGSTKPLGAAQALHVRSAQSLAESHLWVQPAVPPVTFGDTREDTPLKVTCVMDKPGVVVLTLVFMCER